ncbi:MAG: S8 family serine peptidase [Phycisphaerales bacterium]|nr:S8 family serine peptidase [Phycisphaerales bacterium]
MRMQVRRNVLPLIAADQDAIAQTIQKLGGQITGQLIATNGVTAVLPGRALAALQNDPIIHRVWEQVPGSKEIDETVPSIGAPTFWNAGFTGVTWDFGTLDSGVQQNHPCFAGIGGFLAAPGVLTTDLTDGHGTCVGSIITSRDATNRGVAPGADKFLVGYASSDFYGDGDWMVSTASDDPEAINVSWGFGQADPDDYTDQEAWVDALIDDNDLMLVKSCGNSGSTDTTLTRPGTAYNCIAVANMNYNQTTTRTDDFINVDSSRGPSASGRKKPDITAPSQGCTAANAQWATQTDWVGFGGTSGAAPHVTGTFLLLGNVRGSSNPYVNKAILINAADAWSDNATAANTDDFATLGSTWNKAYGWGYLDANETYVNATDAFLRTNGDASSATPRSRLFRGTMFSNEKATLVWNKKDTYIGTAIPIGGLALTDLDLFAYNAESNAILDSSTSSIDNVEQIGLGLLLAPNTSRDVVLRVYTFSSAIAGAGNTETYGLATEENFAEVTGPDLSGSALLPDQANPGAATVVRVVVGNGGDTPAHNISVVLTLPAGWSFASGQSNTEVIPTIGSGGFLNLGVAEFNVNVPCSAVGTPTLSWTISSNSYGMTFTGSGSETISIVAPAALVENTPQTFSEVGKIFSFPITSNEFSFVAINPRTADLDIRGSANSCGTAPWASSTSGGTIRDFIVANGYNVAAGTNFASVFRFSGDLPTWDVEFERGFDVSIGSVPQSNTWESTEIIEPYEINLTAGRRYRINALVTSGTLDLGIRVFDSATTFSSRGAADASRNAAGPGGSEFLYFTPTATGVHAIALLNENGAAGATSFSVRCGADYNNDGAVTVADIFDFLNDWFASSLRADFNANGTPDVADIFDFLNAWFAGC